jgi:hypothetical protein
MECTVSILRPADSILIDDRVFIKFVSIFRFRTFRVRMMLFVGYARRFIIIIRRRTASQS